MRSPRARAFSKVFAVLILSALLPTAMRAFQRFSNAPDASTSPDVEWDSYGLDYAETRYSPLSQINSTNVSRLGLAWTYDVPPGRGEASAYGEETTPLMVNGTLYSITGWSVTYAVDAQTGKEKWRYDPKVDRHHFRKLKALGMNRGVGFYAGRIFVPVFDGRLVALNADTGDVVWSVQTTPLNQNYTITMAPRVVKGKVVIGNSGAEFPV